MNKSEGLIYKDNNTWFKCSITLPSSRVREKKISQTILLQFLSLIPLLVKNFNKEYCFALTFLAAYFFCKSEQRTLPILLNSTNCPQKWTFLSLPGLFLKRRTLQYYLEIPLCWPLKETIEEELQLHWVHMSLSASKITKVGHSSKKENSSWNCFFVMIYMIYSIKTILFIYEPVSIENNQNWTLKQERKVLQRQWNETVSLLWYIWYIN